jgi:hypothetical protein
VSGSAISNMAIKSSLLASGAYVPVVIDGDPTNYRFDLAAGLAGVSRIVTPQLYGAVADGVTDDSAAFVAAIAALKASAINTVGNTKASGRLFVPAGYYYMGTTTLDITHTLIIEGEGTGFDGAQPSRLRWAAGTTGIRVQRFNTSGAGTVDGPHFGGDGTIIRGLYFQGAYSGTEAEAHAIHLKARATVENCLIIDFQGDGIYANATAGSGGAIEGNANNCRILDNTILRCRNGLFIDGADTNIWEVRGNDTSQHRRWGVYDSSFLGNQYFAHHASGNGVTVGSIPTMVINSGNQYCARKGGTWTNAPSGTSADTADWYYMGAGVANAGLNIGAWSGAVTYRDGGSYRADGEGNSYGVFMVYAELGQGYAQIDGPAQVWGAIKGQVKGVGTTNGSSTGLYSSNGFSTDGNVKALGNFSEFGPQTGALDGVVRFYNTNSRSDLFFYQSGTLRGFCSTVGTTMAIGSQTGQTDLYAVAAVVCSVKSTGFGYVTGVGGAVTQATSRTTGVTLNKVCGQVTLFSAAGTATWQTFTVTNSNVAATDVIRLNQASGTDKYMLHVTKVQAGSFDISFATTGGTTTEQPVFNFSVMKASAS